MQSPTKWNPHLPRIVEFAAKYKFWSNFDISASKIGANG